MVDIRIWHILVPKNSSRLSAIYPPISNSFNIIFLFLSKYFPAGFLFFPSICKVPTTSNILAVINIFFCVQEALAYNNIFIITTFSFHFIHSCDCLIKINKKKSMKKFSWRLFSRISLQTERMAVKTLSNTNMLKLKSLQNKFKMRKISYYSILFNSFKL